ncbi:hypothetical protein FACS189464_1190 [Bacteroidia bacterium]|nr:hypothetical protein FACS189464_1190 [Bacteroidia bacterium]
MMLDIIDNNINNLFMKKVIIVIFLCFLPFAFIYSQLGVDSDCTSNIENIFKVHDLKIKYETVQYIYEENKQNRRFPKDSDFLNSFFEIVRGFPLYPKEQKDSICEVNLGELVEVVWMSKEEMDSYIEQLNCTPQDAFKEYRDLIQQIKSEKELYLKYLDAELAKGNLSGYSKSSISPYNFIPPGWSLTGFPASVTKLDFLKVFKEFIFNDNEEVLPDGMRVSAYLKCNCKIP